MKVLVIGGDGFCGWPTVLHLSMAGHCIGIIDDLSRRRIDEELGALSLTPIETIETRIKAWKEISGNSIDFFNFSVGEGFEQLKACIKEFSPGAIIHFGEQRAAPYSMKSAEHKRYTIKRNVNATHDILAAIVDLDLDIHIIHLGTMGVYGYGALEGEIPEGYLEVEISHTKQKHEILYPTSPGSIYHLTKSLDQLIFQFYAKNDKLRITDLHQGVVWGTQTQETKLDPRLINRFDYDGEYGTVLNRFLMQAAIKYPLTVYGTGGQRRAFIHIQDTVRCIKLAIDSPPQKGERVKIINQVTEVHTVKDLAEVVSQMTGIPIENTVNPRQELEENNLDVSNSTFINLGINPITLSKGLMEEVIDITEKYKNRCNIEKIKSTSYWNSTRKTAVAKDENK